MNADQATAWSEMRPALAKIAVILVIIGIGLQINAAISDCEFTEWVKVFVSGWGCILVSLLLAVFLVGWSDDGPYDHKPRYAGHRANSSGNARR